VGDLKTTSRLSPVHDRPGNRAGDWYWYRQKIISWLHRYTFPPNLCISLAPVHMFIISTTANQKASSRDWYRQKITSGLHRYTFSPNSCIALAPVHMFIIFTTANQKASSRDWYRQKSPLDCTGTHFYKILCI